MKHEKQTQYCKEIILQLKKENNKNKKDSKENLRTQPPASPHGKEGEVSSSGQCESTQHLAE